MAADGSAHGGGDDAPDTAAAIECAGLTKRFGSFTALDHLDLVVQRGEVFGYLGPNGAGKSTTLRVLLGLIRASSGTAKVMGTDVGDVKEVHRQLAYVPGDVSLWPRLTGAECLAFFEHLRGGIDTAYRDELIDRFKLDTSKRARAYSKGNRQKVALVAAFAARPELLLLDEPTAGLDPLMEQEFQRCVHEATERGQTVFLSSHILSEVQELCSRVGILRDGVLVEVAAIEKLRALHRSQLEIDFDGPAPDFSGLEGVTAVSPTPSGVCIELTGTPAAVLKMAAEHGVSNIRSREASLEEIFLTYYGSDGAPSSDTPEAGTAATRAH
jgi:ABC-2 type transport system ATP-binding protein